MCKLTRGVDISAFSHWLRARGAEILAPQQNEALRFRAGALGTGALYLNRSGSITASNPVARTALSAFRHYQPWRAMERRQPRPRPHRDDRTIAVSWQGAD